MACMVCWVKQYSQPKFLSYFHFNYFESYLLSNEICTFLFCNILWGFFVQYCVCTIEQFSVME